MILHLDLSTGASGDKMLGALIELCEKLGVCSFDELARKAHELLPEVTVTRAAVTNGGVLGTHIIVNYHDAPIEELGLTSHGHTSHNHTSHDSASHAHSSLSHTPHNDTARTATAEHAHSLQGAEHRDEEQSHRHWSDIKHIIQDAADRNIVSASAAELALRVFTRVATAEAMVHGVTLDEVHFHEVGAADSIVDILFNSFLLDALGASDVYATPLALGNGTFICAHGELPVPAPATAEILMHSGVSVYASSHEGELTTPTGAALVSEFVTQFAPLPCSKPLAVGYGAGTREVKGAANTLRVLAAEPDTLSGLTTAQERESGLFVQGVTLLECNLDHLSAETIAFACEELLNVGALDVWQEAIVMKKGRLATKLAVLTQADKAQMLAQRIIELTGSLGVRASYLERTIVAREAIIIETPYGPVPFKAAAMDTPPNRRHWIRPEHDSVAELARERDLNYQDLYKELQEFGQCHTCA